jgi:hypothetical protein
MKRWISSIPLLLLLVASLASSAEKKASGSRLQNGTTISCSFQLLRHRALHLINRRLPWLAAFLRCLADGVTGVRHDAVFRPKKFLQRLGQHGGQFLPGQQLQPTT